VQGVLKLDGNGVVVFKLMEAGLTVQHSMANSVLSDEYKPQVKSVPVIPF
jgi:hypothetical protein